MSSFIKYPNGNLLLRDFKKEFPVITHAKGVRLFDADGKDYIDGCSGAFVVSLGHSNTELLERTGEIFSKVTYVNGTQFTNSFAEELADKLVKFSGPLGKYRSGFLSSGSEAIEAALKLTRQIQVVRGHVNRTKYISRNPSYHGNTLFALSASNRPSYKAPYEPYLIPFESISTPSRVLLPAGIAWNQATEYYLKELDRAINTAGPESIVALILEPISGSSAFGSTPPDGYLEQVQKLCEQYGILTISDEVLCGVGRSGEFFASYRFGFKPDIIALGKGLSSGIVALSALLLKEDHTDAIAKSSGKIQHAQTFMNTPGSCAAGIAVCEYLETHKIIENVPELESKLNSLILEPLSTHQNIGGINSSGLIFGFELVADKKNNKPFPRSKKVTENFAEHAQKNGLTVWPNTGHNRDGSGDAILLGPPLTITDTELEELSSRLITCLGSFKF